MKLTVARAPRDGKPYYCIRCGLGFSEYMACKDVGCKLETEASAEVRQVLVDAATAGRLALSSGERE